MIRTQPGKILRKGVTKATRGKALPGEVDWSKRVSEKRVVVEKED